MYSQSLSDQKGSKMSRLSSFNKKEVVNLPDGRRLGFLCDAEVDLTTGKVESIVISVPSKILTAGAKGTELVIPFNKIKKVGEDIILVNVEERYLNYFLRGQS